MAAHKKAQQLARQLLQLSLENGTISADRVAAVLAHVEKTKPAHSVEVLRTYQRLVARELARSVVRVEHAGAVAPGALDQISAALSRRYGRSITWVAQPNSQLIAGLRLRVGDDVFESSVSGQLSTLAASA